MKTGFLYSYYEEDGKEVAIIHKNTPQETIDRLKQKYDEVRCEE